MRKPADSGENHQWESRYSAKKNPKLSHPFQRRPFYFLQWLWPPWTTNMNYLLTGPNNITYLPNWKVQSQGGDTCIQNIWESPSDIDWECFVFMLSWLEWASLGISKPVFYKTGWLSTWISARQYILLFVDRRKKHAIKIVSGMVVK